MRKKFKYWLRNWLIDNEFDQLWSSLTQLGKRVIELEKNKSYMKGEDFVPDDSMMAKVIGHLRAIEEHLGVRVKETLEEDKSVWKWKEPETPKIKVWRAEKLK